MTKMLWVQKARGPSASFALAAILSLCAGAAYSAGATTLTSTGVNLLDARTVQFGSNTSSGQTQMGAWEVNKTGGDQGFWVYCLDPLNSYTTPDTYNEDTLDQFVTGGAYATLFASGDSSKGYQKTGVVGVYDDSNTNTATVLNKLKSLYSHAYADSLTDKRKSAAFQFAIWEIEGESAASYSRDTGGLEYKGTDSSDLIFTTTLDSYLSGLNNGTWGSLSTVTNYTYTVFNPNPSGGQALLRVTAGGTAVPEPGSLALAGLALAGVVYTRRQSKAGKNA